jgi:lipid-A-disaccharide synthase
MKVMLVAAEASGDVLGAGLMRALRQRMPDITFIGTGGRMMAAEGLSSLFDISDLGVLGFIEGVKALPRVRRRAREVAVYANSERPDAVVLIDSWGFTLRVAHRIRALCPTIPLIKYVGPQVWGSRPGRAKTLAKAVDHLMSIHAFDVRYFEDAGLKTSYVGNPVLARRYDPAGGARFRALHELDPHQPVLLVVPGSRRSEIENVYPAFATVAQQLMADRPDLAVVVPVSASISDILLPRLKMWPTPPIIVTEDAEKDDAFVAADVALACSGTVTTELAIAGCPVIVAYRFAGWLSYALIKAIATTDKAALMNIAMGRYVAPEFLQDDCTPEKLLPVVSQLLNNPDQRAKQVVDQTAALAKMGRPADGPSLDAFNPSACAAETLIQILNQAL